MFRKATLRAAAITALITLPVLGALSHAPIAHASQQTITYVVNGTTKTLTYNSGTNGCTGTPVIVYGSTALQTFVQQAAANDCNAQPAGSKATYRDVEYATSSPGGDSCPGLEFVSNSTTANSIGAADVFAPSCPSTFVINPSNVVDTVLAGNAVEAIVPCPGANEPQGGAPNEANRFPTPQTPCQGAGSGSLHFPAPNNISVPASTQLWSNALFDFAQVGGTLGTSPVLQERQTGSGTRITFCDNIFGPGLDSSCQNSSSAGPTSGTKNELNAVCGAAFGNTSGPAQQGAGAIGYVTRAAATIDARQATGSTQYPMPGCGIVSLGGVNAYNADCDPSNSATFTASNSATNPVTGVATCNGDLQVAEGQYAAWGYVHLSVNTHLTNTDANAFINYAVAQQALLETQGFIRSCKMLFTRAIDGGSLTANPSANC